MYFLRSSWSLPQLRITLLHWHAALPPAFFPNFLFFSLFLVSLSTFHVRRGGASFPASPRSRITSRRRKGVLQHYYAARLSFATGPLICRLGAEAGQAETFLQRRYPGYFEMRPVLGTADAGGLLAWLLRGAWGENGYGYYGG
jgi:hypothetical protein